ncbi:heterokaryon incompatibility protein-domain-containing protein [Cercophora newfieldiana]|uniref:Heterokaryon incompatibility protein-domain-containing protein n=1 Tax=Cercophora newfieldiana TaxID=92897 RepID=A0AA39Y2M5_9PEZI|nr:heterokaryon incompatibility protein-domain-containing protein [Cercophora newfieldiana]
MNLLNKVVQTAKWVDGSPRRCGACLFELDHSAKPASFDVHSEWERMFWTSDTRTSPFPQLVRSASRGCAKCASVLDFLKQAGLEQRCTAIEWFPSRGWNSGQPQINCQLDGGKVVELEICVSPEETEDLIVDGISTAHPSLCRGAKISGGTGDSEALTQAARWLGECREKHVKCHKVDETFVPTRLLRIGGHETMALCEKVSGHINYAALSHHWSEETQAVILKTTNIEQRKIDGITISDLPQMMQDVVAVLRGLKIDYVWIDSLCIIQDSSEDWLQEAASMAQVYSNAEVTIAATWCHGSGQSLFNGRGDSEFLEVDLPGTGSQSPLFVRRSIPHFHWKNSTPTLQEEQGLPPAQALWPLLGRGWVYQEQWLSRRTLHFTEHEIIWICSETTACECAYYSFGDVSRHGQLATEGTRTQDWKAIVEEYSERAFTQITDRLPALAGIATVHLKSDDDVGNYLCGLWSKGLPETLFWHTTSSTPGPRPPMTMPTWSWASITGSVEFDYPDDEIQPKILDAQVNYLGRELMGDVTEAMLRVEGLIASGGVFYGEQWEHLLKNKAKALSDVAPESKHGLEIDGCFINFTPDYALETPGKHFVPDGASVACLLFGRGDIGHCDPEHPETNNEMNYVSGIVLRNVSEGGSIYERIGYFTGSDFDDAFEFERTVALAEKRVFTLM